MNIVMPIESEILSPDELAGLCGRTRKDDQRTWLNAQGWNYLTNAAGAPIVGRWYARLKMAGVDMKIAAPISTAPDFSKAR